MHLQTHILASWCLGNGIAVSGRQRLFCMFAGMLPDLDGLTYAAGEKAYQEYHHLLAHNLVFGVVVAAVLAALSQQRRGVVFAVYLALFHLHLLMDYFGSGPLWRIYYLWPFSRWALLTPADAWELLSWQNISAFSVCFIGTILIAKFYRRTPLEVPMPSLDRQLVALLSVKRKGILSFLA